MKTAKKVKITNPFRQDGWILISIAIVSILDLSASFTVPQHSSLTVDLFDRKVSRRCRSQVEDHRICRDTTKLFSTAQDEDMLAFVEDGTLDMKELEEIFGEDFDFDDLEDDEDMGEEYDDDDDDNGEEVEEYDEEVDDEKEEYEMSEFDEGADGEEYEDFEVEGNFEGEDDEEDDENETELIMKFAEECRGTAIGELDASDAELIREILGNIPVTASIVEEQSQSDADSSTLKASYMVESLLHRFVDEWSGAVKLVENKDDSQDEDFDITLEDRIEREQLFQPIASDFHKTIVAIWNDEQNKDSFDVKAERISHLVSEQRDIISFFDDKDTLAAEALYPTHRSIEILLESLSRSSIRGVDRKAAEIVEEWLPELGMIPSPGIYGPYIQMVAKARNRGAARNAESILRKAVSLYPPNKYESPIGVDIFNTVVTAYAKARGIADGPKKAQELIVFMDSLDAPGCAPNAKTFTSLIDAYAQTNEWESVTEAQGILNNLLNQYLLQEGEGEHLEPSVATWTIVIAAWMRLAKKGRRGAAKRAGDLLRRMDSLSSSDRITAKPDAITYVTVFTAYASSKTDDEVEEAEGILEEMNEQYLDGDDSFKPSVRSIKILIESWIKIGAVDRAEQVLKTYEDILEDAENNNDEDSRHSMDSQDWQDIYKSILIGYTRMGNLKRAMACLNLMIENDDMEPDSMCYERIIDAHVRLAKEDCAQKSQEIFQLLEKRRQAGALRPTERVYTGFIRALTKSKVQGLHKKADLVLRRMQSLAEEGNTDVQPSIFTYNAVLNACAESASIEGTPYEEAFQTSVRVFTRLREEMEPDHVTFANMIRCANLIPSDSNQQKKDKFVTATFKLSCESGNVNNYMLRDLSRVASKDLLKVLTGYSSASEDGVEIDIEEASFLLERLPPSWQRRTIDRQKPSGNRRPGNNYRS